MAWTDEVLQGFREGKPEVLAAVFRAYSERLIHMVRRMPYRGLGSGAFNSSFEIENTVLETFARAFSERARANYDGSRPYDRYLFGIARNVVLEQARGREMAVGLCPMDDEALELVEAEERSPVQQAEARELAELLEEFCTGLDADEQALYEARYIDELGQEGAAERLHLTRIQLRRREMKLKKKLLAFLKERGYLTGLNPGRWSFFRR